MSTNAVPANINSAPELLTFWAAILDLSQTYDFEHTVLHLSVFN